MGPARFHCATLNRSGDLGAVLGVLHASYIKSRAGQLAQGMPVSRSGQATPLPRQGVHGGRILLCLNGLAAD